MGRSTSSCFKIITCGSDSVDKDDAGASEGKGSSDKRGWSFRKKSSGHRVLSNTVISESPSSIKEQPETANVKLQTHIETTSVETAGLKLQTQPDSVVTEKSPVIPSTEEKAQSFDPVISNLPDTKDAKKDDAVYKVIPDESVIKIQAAIRKHLAQRETLKLKNVIKLQAAVRGHLVRRHAVGTLRCVQAIVKMQSLVRARRLRLSSEVSCAKGKEDDNLLENVNSATKKNNSIEKLLSNKFAHQLLETAPKTKRIHIKCDPSKFDSAWVWLERWMAASSVEKEQPQELESVVEPQGLERWMSASSVAMEQPRELESVVEKRGVERWMSASNVFQPETVSPSEGLKSDDVEELAPSKSEENVVASPAENLDLLPSQPIPSSESDNQELPNIGNSDSRTKSLDLLVNQNEPEDIVSQEEVKTSSNNLETESEQVETEENKVSSGTRKATNPAFIAAQSKFKELSSTGSLTRSTSSFSQDAGAEVSSDAVSSVMENGKRARDIDESSAQNNSRQKFGGSECGTELSISSTLDSPDRRETGEMNDQEVTSNPNISKNAAETNSEYNTEEPNLSDSIEVQLEKVDDVGDANTEPINVVPAVESLQAVGKSNVNEPDVQKSTPEASPRSHMTAPEFQETPSSQVSVRPERTKSGDRSSSKQKRKSLSAAHKSPSNSNHGSSVRSSLEGLPKESKSGKRRNSFGSVKPDYVDQEPRDSNSSSTLPSYMQATESARAKALPNGSPRSSPDVSKDVQIKKRHSLPGANGRQESPQIQRSASQTKGTGQPQERKWQR